MGNRAPGTHLRVALPSWKSLVTHSVANPSRPTAPIKRDNNYYLDRLRDEHPTIYADCVNERFKNAIAAINAAGLRKTPSALDQPNRAWDKASKADRDAFLLHIGGTASTVIPGKTKAGRVVPSAAPRSISRGDTVKLTTVLAAEIQAIMAWDKLKLGAVMR